MIRLIKTLLALCCLAATLDAQSVVWKPAGGTLAKGETSAIELVFEDCAPKETPVLPAIDGLQFGSPSTSRRSSFNLINGSATRSSTVTVSYPVVATAPLGTAITIPALNIATDEGTVRAAPVTFTVAEATVGDNRARLADVARSRFIPPPVSVWQGQVFALGYALEVDKNYFYQLGSHLDWQPAPLIIEDWPQPDSTEILQAGVRKIRINYRTLALAPTAGELSLKPASQLVNLNTGTTSFGFFGRAQLEQYAVTSEPAAITVKPLPSPAPAGFNGAVGDFTLTAKAVPLDAQVGEPVTWTLTLEGMGNWPSINALPSREVSKDFRVVQPQARRTPAREGALFQATLSEDVVLIPTTPGTHTLGPVSLVVFDPAKGEYRTLTTEKFTVNVTGVAATPSPAPAAPDTTSTDGETSSAPHATTTGPAPVKSTGVIPLDPLPAAAPVAAPLPTARLVWLLPLPFALPPLLWLVLALRRSRRTDPARPLREARDRLSRTLDQIAEQATPELVRAWRDDTARLWRLDVATPTPRDFPDPVWGALWAESERVLYRRGTAIAPQWIAQARQALALHAVPSWSPLQLFRARNLFPWLATIALLLAALPALPAQPAEAYAAGDFAQAGEAWRARIQESPTDWSARHNLSLALAQQNRWDEAAAHAAVAWLQSPASNATRWQLALAANKSPKVAAAFAPFVVEHPRAVDQLARLAGPARWQFVLIAAAAMAATALTLLVLSGYTRFAAGWALGLFCIALLTAATATVALRAYAPFLPRDTVLVWREATLRSVPTEAAKEQQTTTVKPGTLARVGKDFLGWSQIVLPDGQTGWLRATDLTGLWANP